MPKSFWKDKQRLTGISITTVLGEKNHNHLKALILFFATHHLTEENTK
jgi:hypothetical protein